MGSSEHLKLKHADEVRNKNTSKTTSFLPFKPYKMTYKANGCEYLRIRDSYASDFWVEDKYKVFVIDLIKDIVTEVKAGKDFDFETTKEKFFAVDLHEYIN